jgi:aminoglycoside 6'-N-acetyltransferase I
MSVRPMSCTDRAAVCAMMTKLLPNEPDYDFRDEHVFVWEEKDGSLGGFASISIRAWADGCDSEPCPYVEGWYVEPQLRHRGIGTVLIRAIESWCVEHGYSELGSDAELTNAASMQAHVALGFEPTLQVQYFRKRLSAPTQLSERLSSYKHD